MPITKDNTQAESEKDIIASPQVQLKAKAKLAIKKVIKY